MRMFGAILTLLFLTKTILSLIKWWLIVVAENPYYWERERWRPMRATRGRTKPPVPTTSPVLLRRLRTVPGHLNAGRSMTVHFHFWVRSIIPLLSVSSGMNRRSLCICRQLSCQASSREYKQLLCLAQHKVAQTVLLLSLTLPWLVQAVSLSRPRLSRWRRIAVPVHLMSVASFRAAESPSEVSYRHSYNWARLLCTTSIDQF